MDNSIITQLEQELIEPEKPAKKADIVVLKPFDEIFAQEYAKTGNGTESYGKAYDMDLSEHLTYANAATMANRKLKNVKIVARINQLLSLNDFNDESMDTQLNFIAHQHSDLKTKLGAIKEYNALKGRTGNKSNVFSGNTFNLVQALRQASQESTI